MAKAVGGVCSLLVYAGCKLRLLDAEMSLREISLYSVVCVDID